ncbi:HK97 family phage prohead protease [Aeromonas salmonicida]|uniref:HK97 family phage prohead protease n=1 Tax=Aeromonas salmonicida TaxID=645 RepID=UPI003D1D2842
MQHKDYQFNITTFNRDSYEFSGYGNTFNFKDYAGDITQPGAFKKSLEQHVINKTSVPILWQHDTTKPIGVWLSAVEDEKGLLLTGRLTKGVQAADEAMLLISSGAVSGLSIGYLVVNERYDAKKQANLLIEIELRECSIVTFPCNTQSRIDAVKSKFKSNSEPTEREFEKALCELGCSRSQAKAFMANGYQGFKGFNNVNEPADLTDTADIEQEHIEATALGQPENQNINTTVESTTDDATLSSSTTPDERLKAFNEIMLLLKQC